MSSRRKNKSQNVSEKQSILDILKRKAGLYDVRLLNEGGISKIIAFKIGEINIILESHTREDLTLNRLTNSFNLDGMDIKKDITSLLETANRFNNGSIGIKASVSEKDSKNIIKFTIEDIIPLGSSKPFNADSIYVKASILSGAPIIFEAISKEKE